MSLPRKELIWRLAEAAAGSSCPAHSSIAATTVPVRLSKRRTFEKAAQPAEYAFEMVCSNLRYGPGVTQELGLDLQNWGVRRVLVFTDRTVGKLPAMREALDSLTRSQLRFDVFDDVRIEPTDTSFKKAIVYAKEANPGCDAVVAVGGGSVMDTAKVANLFLSNPSAEFEDFLPKPHGHGKYPTNPLLPLVCIPTTAGTGSETTTVAIFDYEKEKVKIGFRLRQLKPLLALIDPLHLQSIPRHVAIYTGFDTLCHALESFTALPYYQRRPRPLNPIDRPVYQGSNPFSDVWAREALRIVAKYHRRAVDDPEDIEARSNMLMASSYAGMGFGNAGVHLCHGLSYPISGLVKHYCSPDYPQQHALVPHGLAVIMTAPADFRFTGEACPDRHLEAARLLGVETDGKSLHVAGDCLGDALRDLMQSFKVANGLKTLGYERNDCVDLAQTALHSFSARMLAPKDQSVDELIKLYENSFEVY